MKGLCKSKFLYMIIVKSTFAFGAENLIWAAATLLTAILWFRMGDIEVGAVILHNFCFCANWVVCESADKSAINT